MGLIGSAVGGVAGIAGGFFAGNALNKGFEEQQKLYNQRLTDVKAHRDKVYYQDPTQTADNQAALTQARELLNEQTKRTAGSNAVTGGTDESVALQKAQATQAVGQMLQHQAASGEAKKEQAYQAAESQIDAFTKYLADSKLQQAHGKAQAISQAAGAFSSAASMMPF